MFMPSIVDIRERDDVPSVRDASDSFCWDDESMQHGLYIYLYIYIYRYMIDYESNLFFLNQFKLRLT